MHEHDYAVIMAGGGGTRLWPISRRDRPKQLLPLLGGETLFQGTVARLTDLFPTDRIIVVTVEQQAAEMQRQIPEIPASNYLIEPAPRGTASAVGLAAAVLSQRDPQAVMAVLPADHFIRNRDLFTYLLREALEIAREGYLVTLGITPTFASSAYGYIQQGDPVDGNFKYPVYRVRRFIEKPEEKTAQDFLRSRDHSWNSGMFVWRVTTILGEIQRQMPALHSGLQQIAAAWATDSRQAVLDGVWSTLTAETIDYGVMEKAAEVVVLPAGGLGWNDVGSWETLFEVLFPDMDGNVSTISQHLAVETHNTLVYGHDTDRLIVTIGMDDTVIVDAADVLLVCKADQAQKVREVVEHLRKHRQEKYL
jgi:mannose-1-phosphate guanylyltransferase